MPKLKIKFHYASVGSEIECTASVLMPCGKVLDAHGLRDTEEKARNVAGNILREAVRVHQAKCKRGCNSK